MKLLSKLLIVLCLSLPSFASSISVANGFNADWLTGRTLWLVPEDAGRDGEVVKADFTADHVIAEGGSYNQPYTIINGIIKIDESGVQDGNTTYPAGSYQYAKILKIEGNKIIVSDTMATMKQAIKFMEMAKI